MTRVIFLNGPPRSGKDTAGQIIVDAVSGARAVKFAHTLKIATHALFAALHGRLPSVTESAQSLYEFCKDEPRDEFFGKTPREAYIAVSELLCKPLFGPKFFGTLLAARIAQQPDVPLWVITDSGFADEAQPIIESVGRDNCTLVKMHRKGCTFDNDSRFWLSLGLAHELDVANNGSLDSLRREIIARVL